MSLVPSTSMVSFDIRGSACKLCPMWVCHRTLAMSLAMRMMYTVDYQPV